MSADRATIGGMTDFQQYTPLPLLPFQKRFLQAASSGRNRVVALTMGRGGGKTFLCGLLAADEVVRGGEVVSVAAAQHQAAILARDAAAALRFRFGDDLVGGSTKCRFRVVDTMQLALIEDRRSGGTLRSVGSRPQSLHGIRPSLIIGDELAQWNRGSAEALFNALMTSLGKRRGGRMIVVGTRPADDDHFYARLLDEEADDMKAFKFAAGKDDPPFHRRTLRKAIPGLDFIDPQQIAYEVRQAKKDVVALQAYRSLRLNLGEPEAPIGGLVVEADEWLAARRLPQAERQGGYVLGYDLGGSRSLSSAVAYWPRTGRVEVRCLVGGRSTLEERGRRHRIDPSLFIRAEADGELRMSDLAYPDIRVLLEWAFADWGGPPYLVTADRWRVEENRQALEDMRLYDRFEPLSPAGRQGIDIIPAFRRALTAGRIRPAPPCRLLDYAVSTARVRQLDTGDLVLNVRDKVPGAMDDPLAALLLACRAGTMRPEHRRQPARHIGTFTF